MLLSVIVPVRDDAKRLASCLASIAIKPSQDDLEIIVADNGSTDDSAGVAERAGAHVLSLPGLRVAALRNTAAREARGAILAFIDADHQLVGGWTAAAIDATRNPAVGAAGARYTPPPNGTWVQRMYGVLRGQTVGISETDWLGSGNMVVRREAFERVGGFDESLETCEDVDLCRRLRSAGFKVVGDERLLSIHHGDPPTLRALFRAERWRGRDNLRVSLRGTPGWRDLPSIVIPVLSLAALGTLVLSPVIGTLAGGPGLRLAAASVGLIVVFAAVRAMRMTMNLGRRSPIAIGQAFAAAIVYDTARAMALVGRSVHHRQ